MIQPLHGAKVVITRPEVDGKTLGDCLATLGAAVQCLAQIEIRNTSFEQGNRPNSGTQDGSSEAGLMVYDWVLFSSRHAVSAFEKQGLFKVQAGAAIGAVGAATAGQLRSVGIDVSFCGDGKGLGPLVKQMQQANLIQRKKVLYPCSNLALERFTNLVSSLAPASSDISITPQVVYNVSPIYLDTETKQTANWEIAVFASPSQVKAYHRNFSQTKVALDQISAVSIGPTTTAALRAFSPKQLVQAESATTTGLVEGVCRCYELQQHRERH